VDLTELVLDDGTVTRADGRVVAYEAKTWFEPMAWSESLLAAPRPSEYAVSVLGVDIDTLGRRREQDGGVEGYATLSGIWAEDALVVSHQAGPGLLPDHHAERPTRPEQAWPRADVEAAYDALRHHMHPWLAYEIGQAERWDGTLLLSAKVVRVLPGLVEWARQLPEGVLALDVWLAPHPHAL
jgi:hypothetical protein